MPQGPRLNLTQLSTLRELVGAEPSRPRPSTSATPREPSPST